MCLLPAEFANISGKGEMSCAQCIEGVEGPWEQSVLQACHPRRSVLVPALKGCGGIQVMGNLLLQLGHLKSMWTHQSFNMVQGVAPSLEAGGSTDSMHGLIIPVHC